MKDDEESILSKFSNQDPGSGGYGEKEKAEVLAPTKSKISAAVKSKKKNKKKAAKKSRKKNRK
ncbi:hypothetical protein MNBD_NITROSPIRAE01-1052 [hydrothermal vent metagenome]|uniref:Uncharacterized protein n=1 Tax=hydrothermal vent metagenome TaxID=652676 RepID=A0A3B1CLU3_9ZZZZ